MKYNKEGWAIPYCDWCEKELDYGDYYFDFGDRLVCEDCIQKEKRSMNLCEWRYINDV